MTEKYIYGNKVTNVRPASGAKGVLIRSGSQILFRVYSNSGKFIDYEILHDDLSVIIERSEQASFYSNGEHHILDHSPGVFDLERVIENDT